MKKTLFLVLVTLLTLILLFSMTACGKKQEQAKYTAEELLDKIYENTKQPTISSYNLIDSAITTAEQEFWLGLTKEDFEKYVDEAALKQYEITAITHAGIVIKLKDNIDYEKVFEKIKDKLSLDKFGCLKPEKAIISQSGKYIFIVWSEVNSSDYSYGANDLSKTFSSILNVDNSFDLT